VLPSCANSNDLKSSVIPNLQAYDNINNNKFKINNKCRIIVAKNAYNSGRNSFFFDNLAYYCYKRLLNTKYELSSTPITTLLIDSFNDFKPQKGDICLEYVNQFKDIDQHKYSVSTQHNTEAYQIFIDSHITINMLNSNVANDLNTRGFLYGIVSLLQLQITRGGINYGVITD
jgi:hypothetical protein